MVGLWLTKPSSGPGESTEQAETSEAEAVRLVETDRDSLVNEVMAVLDDSVSRERMGSLGESLRR